MQHCTFVFGDCCEPQVCSADLVVLQRQCVLVPRLPRHGARHHAHAGAVSRSAVHALQLWPGLGGGDAEEGAGLEWQPVVGAAGRMHEELNTLGDLRTSVLERLALASSRCLRTAASSVSSSACLSAASSASVCICVCCGVHGVSTARACVVGWVDWVGLWATRVISASSSCSNSALLAVSSSNSAVLSCATCFQYVTASASEANSGTAAILGSSNQSQRGTVNASRDRSSSNKRCCGGCGAITPQVYFFRIGFGFWSSF